MAGTEGLLGYRTFRAKTKTSWSTLRYAPLNMSLKKLKLENNTEYGLRAPNWLTFSLSKHLLNEIEHSRGKGERMMKDTLSNTTYCENWKDSM